MWERAADEFMGVVFDRTVLRVPDPAANIAFGTLIVPASDVRGMMNAAGSTISSVST